MSQQALINREEEIVLDCALQNDQHTVVKSAKKIRALPGSSSGTSSFFHAKIEECPTQKWEGDNGETYSSSYQNDHTTLTVLEGVNNLSTLNPTDRQAISTTLYPNPTTGLLTMQHSQIITHVEAVDAFGRSVVRTTPNSSNVTIDLNGNTSGLYVIRVSNKDGSKEHYRVILQSQ